MSVFRIALMAISMFSVVSLQAQTVDEIVNKYLDAMGGKEKVASMKSMHIEYDVDMNGAAATGASWVINGKAFKNEVNIMGQQIVQCYTDTSGWMINPFGGAATPTAMTPEMVQMGQGQMDMGGPFLNYAAKGNTIELLGKDKLGDKPVYKLKVKTKIGQEIIAWIDASSYYLLKNDVKVKANGMDIETTMTFSNYKKTEDGFVVPYNMEILMSGVTINMMTKTAEINKDIDRKIFEMPKQ